MDEVGGVFNRFNNWLNSFFVTVNDPVNGIHKVLNIKGDEAIARQIKLITDGAAAITDAITLMAKPFEYIGGHLAEFRLIAKIFGDMFNVGSSPMSLINDVSALTKLEADKLTGQNQKMANDALAGFQQNLGNFFKGTIFGGSGGSSGAFKGSHVPYAQSPSIYNPTGGIRGQWYGRKFGENNRDANYYGPRLLGEHDIALSPDLQGRYPMGSMVDAYDRGRYLGVYKVGDTSYKHRGVPNHNNVEFRDRKIDSNDIELRPHVTINIHAQSLDSHGMSSVLREHGEKIAEHVHKVWRSSMSSYAVV